jgi:Uma2 family endonuclease
MPVDIQLADGDVYAPDVLWVNEAHRPPRDARRLYAPPDLAVEVRSPSTWQFDLGTKKRVYEDKGLPELWLVDTSSDTVLVYRRSSPSAREFDVSLELGRGDKLASALLPGLSIDLEELFDL